MKKKLLTLLFVLTAIFSVAILFVFNTSNKAKASDSSHITISRVDDDEDNDSTGKKKIRYKIAVSTNYYTPKYCKKAILHFGVNDWQDVKEQDMVRTGSYEQGSGVFTTYYTYETIVTVNEGDVIDYCFKFITWQDREGWINNENNDYHVKVDTSNVLCSYTVEYDRSFLEASNIASVDLCYTLDNWKTVDYTNMSYHSIIINGEHIRNFYDCTVHGYESDTLEYCFKVVKTDGSIEWDNNNGVNYRVSPLKNID